MNELITFADVLIKPKFSTVGSRKDVDLSINRLGLSLNLGMISSNMDTVTDSRMAIAMAKNGAVGCLHRFWNIQKNVDEFKNVFQDYGGQTMVSIGLGNEELERAEALIDVGAYSVVIDVANGSSLNVVKQVKELRNLDPNIFITVGNFATGESVKTFLEYEPRIDGVKIGIGSGSRCLTRIVTGVGIPQLSAILDVRNTIGKAGLTIIADGGMDFVGDIAKALGAGAHMAMSGSFFAGTYETPGETVTRDGIPCSSVSFGSIKGVYKKYRGSASRESYEVQGKTAKHRSPEGDSTYIPYKGSVADVLQEIEGGLRSAFTYTGSRTLEEFHKNAEFVRVSSNTVIENGTRNGVK